MKQAISWSRYIFTLVFLFFIFPVIVSAQEFIPIVPIPGLSSSGINAEEYLKTIYIIAISAAALLAVVKLILAGFKYVGSDIITEKGSAKKDIQSALIGLLIVLAAVSLLRVINPNLTSLPALERAPRIDVPPPPDNCVTYEVNAETGLRGCVATRRDVAEDRIQNPNSGNLVGTLTRSLGYEADRYGNALDSDGNPIPLDVLRDERLLRLQEMASVCEVEVEALEAVSRSGPDGAVRYYCPSE